MKCEGAAVWGKATAGYTLIEVLVGLAILALAAALLSSSFGFGRRAWEVARKSEKDASIEAVQRLLRQLLGEVKPSAFVGGGKRVVGLRGQRDSADVVVERRGFTELGGLYQTWIGVRPGKGGLSDLLLNQRRAGEPVRAEEGRLLLGGVASVEFSYFGRQEIEAPQWFDEWHREELPQLIAIRIRFGPGDERNWPELVARPALAAASALPAR